MVTDTIEGFTGGDLGDNPVTGIVQQGIDVVQGVESLKTEIINTGIDTVAGTIIGAFPSSEHPVSDLADLGTLTFETSRDTVNGSLETLSDLAAADLNGAIGSATGVIETLVNNGSTAAEIIQHIGENLGNLGDLADGSPLEMVTDAIEGFTGSDLGDNPVTGVIDTITGGTDGSPLEMVTDAIEGFTGGDLGDNPVTGVIDTITGGTDGSPLEMVTDAFEGFTGGDLGDNPVTGVIDTITGGTDGSPLEMVTDAIEGFTGGDLGDNPVTGIVQQGIDVVQGVESLKTEIINTGIDTVAGTIIGAFPESEHPVGDLADLGTLTFETSRDTVNGSLETISDLAGADFDGAMDSATGVIDTLITNGSTATEIIQHIGEDLGNLGDLADGSPLEMVTDAIEGFTGGDLGDNPVTGVIDTITGGTDGSPLEMVTDAIEGFTGGDLGDNPVNGVIDTITGGTDGSPLEMVTDAIEGFTGGDLGDNPVTGVIDTITGGTDGSPLEMVTDAIEGFTGGDLGDNPVTGIVQQGIDVVQGVESLKTEIINTGIDTVAGTIIGAFPESEHPVGDLADLGTLTFETSRDTVNGSLETISDLAGADFDGAMDSATGVIDTLITNGSTATE
ncbi:hypothetical protein ACG93P_14680, partial [Acinetobacter junii]